jgi:hypothetical protein
MGSRAKRTQNPIYEENGKTLMPYGKFEGLQLSETPRWYLEFLIDSIPRTERWLKRKMITELRRRNRIEYEIRRDEQSNSLATLEGKTARQHTHVKPSASNRKSYAGTISPWGTRYPDCWDEMSDTGRKRWNEEQSKLFLKRPLGSLK